MAETEIDPECSQPLPSVDDLKPSDQGGPIARSGFNYQDEIAVSFFIEMLENPSLLKVHCETHDDIVLVHAEERSRTRQAEFVQVKAGGRDKLWSVADICGKKNGVAGTSILETSLIRDKCCEESCFRLVTLRPVVNDLMMLTFPHGGAGREPEGERFGVLQSELEGRFPGLKSPKGNGTTYWLENCYWDVRHSEETVRKDNLLRLIKLSGQEGGLLLPEQVEMLLDELRTWAKAAGDAKWEPDREKKIICREMLREWWERRTCELLEGTKAPSGDKLRTKMAEVGLPPDLVELAVEMRRDYASIARVSRYMEPLEIEPLQRRVKSEVQSLRARFVAGQIDLDPVGFHSLCLERMDAINDERPEGKDDRSAFLKGCVYDIADRCLLHFTRPTS